MSPVFEIIFDRGLGLIADFLDDRLLRLCRRD